MSSFRLVSRRSRAFGRAAMVTALFAAGMAVQACTVRPLYSVERSGAAGAEVSALQKIAVKPAATREGLEVRNHLIFLLNGGSGQSAEAAYSLDLGVTSRTVAAATLQSVTDPKQNEGQPTAGTIVLTANYVLTDSETGGKVASGSRSVSSAFDRPRQEFASYRAERDAQNRAARELAELLRLALAQDLAGR